MANSEIVCYMKHYMDLSPVTNLRNKKDKDKNKNKKNG